MWHGGPRPRGDTDEAISVDDAEDRARGGARTTLVVDDDADLAQRSHVDLACLTPGDTVVLEARCDGCLEVVVKLPLGLAVAVLLWSSAGHPCELPSFDLSLVKVPFEGHTVPRNATLQVLDDQLVAYGELLGPDGVARRVTWPNRDRAAIVPALDDDGLVPGRWSLTLRFEDALEDPSTREVVFGVEDRVDDDAAPVRFTISRRTGGDPPWNVTPCSRPGWPITFVTISLDETVDAEIAWIVVGSDQRQLALEGGAVEIYEDITVDVTDIVAVDFAGNVSVPSAIDEVGGCGCSSNDAPAFIGGLGLLALLRRRRR